MAFKSVSPEATNINWTTLRNSKCFYYYSVFLLFLSSTSYMFTHIIIYMYKVATSISSSCKWTCNGDDERTKVALCKIICSRFAPSSHNGVSLFFIFYSIQSFNLLLFPVVSSTSKVTCMHQVQDDNLLLVSLPISHLIATSSNLFSGSSVTQSSIWWRQHANKYSVHWSPER